MRAGECRYLLGTHEEQGGSWENLKLGDYVMEIRIEKELIGWIDESLLDDDNAILRAIREFEEAEEETEEIWPSPLTQEEIEDLREDEWCENRKRELEEEARIELEDHFMNF